MKNQPVTMDVTKPREETKKHERMPRIETWLIATMPGKRRARGNGKLKGDFHLLFLRLRLISLLGRISH